MTETPTRPGAPNETPPRPRGRRRRRRRWRWLLVALALLVLIGAWAALLAVDAFAARRALLDARAAVADAQGAIGEGDLDAARAAVDAARDAAESATEQTSAPWWDAAAALPIVGDTPRVAQALVAVADAAAEVAAAAVARGEALLGPDGGIPLEIAGGRIALEPLLAAGEALRQVPLDDLEAARARLDTLSDANVPGALVDARIDALALADRVVGTLERGRTALDVLPPFLGGDGPRRYLLGIQTPAELRGTGGLIESVAILAMDGGGLTLAPAADTADDLLPDAVALASQQVVRGEPVAAPPAFEARYGHAGGTRRFDRVNLDPDLPTVAPIALDLYEQVSGDRLDGMVLIDPVALEEVMRAVGPLEIPPPVRDAAGRLPARIPADEIAEWSLDGIYEVFGIEFGDQRQAFKEAVTTSVFARLLAGGYDEVRAGRRLADTAGARHLQLWTRDSDEQRAFRELGIGGAFTRRGEDRDFLTVTAVNAVGSKQDALVGHRVTGELALRAPSEDADRLERSITLRTELVNPLPAAGRDLYVIGNCLLDPPGGGSGCYEGPPGVNRTWFTTWVPSDTSVISGRDAAGPIRGVATDDIHGLTAVDRTVETPPQSETWFEFDYRGPAPARRDGGDVVYTLDWWHQAKAIPTHLDLAVTVPAGWKVVNVDSTGGGDGQGLGALAEGPTLEGTATGRDVRWRGAVTRDAQLEIRLRPPQQSRWERFRDWLGQPLN